MRIYDISQEIFSGAVYKGDPVPAAFPLCRIDEGAPYNLSSVSMCLHNGTHIDAPSHYLENGKTVDRIDLDSCVGPCIVLAINGPVDEEYLQPLLSLGPKRLLFKGRGWLTVRAAKALADSSVVLVGTESQSVGHAGQVAEVHKLLMEKDIVILEGLILKDVPEGNYYVIALPLKFGGLEGSPCRAVLVDYLPAAN